MLNDGERSPMLPFKDLRVVGCGINLDDLSSDDGTDDENNQIEKSTTPLQRSFPELVVDRSDNNGLERPDRDKTQVALEGYLDHCQERGVKPDGGVSICLKVGLDTLQPDGKLTNWELMAIMDVMQKASWVNNLKLAKQPIGDTGAALLARAVLPGNSNIIHLDLKMADITYMGAIILCDELPKSHIQTLSLANNVLCGPRSSVAVSAALRDAVAQTKTLRKVDVSRCNLSEQAMRTIKAGQALRVERGYCQCELDFSGNFLVIEILNSASHAVGVVVAIIFAVYLAVKINISAATSKAALMVYVGSLITMFLNSTLYHSLFYIISSHFVLQALDHTGIYLLIAGSYTPVMVLGCDGGVKTLIMVILYWLTAAVGVGMAIYSPWPKPVWYKRSSLVLYVGMGVAGAPFIIYSEHCLFLQELVMTEVLLGGAAFLCGVPFFVSSVEFPTFHVIWHIFVLVGCIMFMYTVWRMATHGDIESPGALLNATLGQL